MESDVVEAGCKGEASHIWVKEPCVVDEASWQVVFVGSDVYGVSCWVVYGDSDVVVGWMDQHAVEEEHSEAEGRIEVEGGSEVGGHDEVEGRDEAEVGDDVEEVRVDGT